jgi:hypothetical protein
MAGVANWLDLFGAALGGGLTVKVLDIVYQEIRHRSDRKREATQFVDKHLDPLLKTTDELVGKLRSLAEKNFSEVQKIGADGKLSESSHFASLIYLFGCFWAQVELLRREGLSVELGRDKRGKRLQDFLDCLTSRRVRIIDRTAQRAVGELMLIDGHLISFVQFVKAYDDDETFRRWLNPLATVLERLHEREERQRLLQYWVVLHALIDTLDRNHIVTRRRPSLPRALTHDSWVDLKYRVFSNYLPFVKDPQKYLGPPKRRP